MYGVCFIVHPKRVLPEEPRRPEGEHTASVAVLALKPFGLSPAALGANGYQLGDEEKTLHL